MAGDQVFHFTRGQAMARDVYDIVSAPHDVDKAVIVQVTAVTGVVVTRVGVQVSLQVTLVITPKGLAATGRQGQGNDDRALLVRPQQSALVIEHLYVVPRHRTIARAWPRRAALQADAGR